MYLVRLQHWRLLIYFHPKLHKHPLFALRLLAKATQQTSPFSCKQLIWMIGCRENPNSTYPRSTAAKAPASWQTRHIDSNYIKINLEIPNHINGARDKLFRMIQVDESQKFMELNWRSPTVNSKNVQLTIVLHQNLAWSIEAWLALGDGSFRNRSTPVSALGSFCSECTHGPFRKWPAVLKGT